MNEAVLSPTATVRALRQELVESNVDGDVIALHTGKSLIYGLNAVGSRVWQMIAEPVSVPQICTQLCGEYDVDPADCERQVLKLLEDMRAEGLIEVDPAAAPSVAGS